MIREQQIAPSNPRRGQEELKPVPRSLVMFALTDLERLKELLHNVHLRWFMCQMSTRNTSDGVISYRGARTLKSSAKMAIM